MSFSNKISWNDKEVDNIIFDGTNVQNIFNGTSAQKDISIVPGSPADAGISWGDSIASVSIYSKALVLEDDDGRIEITSKELRRIKELLKEKYPEDYI
jgi:hypothetical protein